MPASALSLPQQPLSNTPLPRTLADGLTSSWWRWLDGRRSTAGPAAGGERRAFERLTRRLRRWARKGQTVYLGSTERPYVPVVCEGVSAASELREHGAVSVAIVASSPRLLDELALWRDLDQHHAVVVDVPMSVGCSSALNGRQRMGLDLARRVAEVGIETRLLLRSADVVSSRQLRQLFEEAAACGVSDIRCSESSVPLPRGLGLLFRQLRLQFGMPRAVAGHS